MLKINNIFSQDEIDFLYETIKTKETFSNAELGRLQVNEIGVGLSGQTVKRLIDIAKDATGLPLEMSNASYVEYSNLYGKPNLYPHFDRDKSDLIINIQLESNTSWAIGINLQTYEIEDNSALVFNPNKDIHWRTHKEFKDGEYVRMLFVRFCNPENMSDYSHLPEYAIDDFHKQVVAFRDSYPQV